MRLINTLYHPDLIEKENPKTFERTAARAIVLKGEDLLLVYTRYYDDYTLPGGGIENGENSEEAVKRELLEETGATNIKVVDYIGAYEEYRPYYKGYDQLHMISHIYLCSIDHELGQAQPEDYEIRNGSVPVWKNIHEAIEHNEKLLRDQPDSMGQSVIRELELFQLIRDELLS